MTKIPIYLRDWLNEYHEPSKKYLYQELAEEFCEQAGEPQDSYILKEEWKKHKTLSDECFREYVEEAYDEYMKTVESEEFWDWVADTKFNEFATIKDRYEYDLENYVENNGVELAYEFNNLK